MTHKHIWRITSASVSRNGGLIVSHRECDCGIRQTNYGDGLFTDDFTIKEHLETNKERP